MRITQQTIAKAFLTMGGVGYIPWAPGTWGSLVSIPLLLLVRQLWLAFFSSFTLLFLLGFFVLIVVLAEKAIVFVISAKRYDLPSIVIDEFLGMFVTLLPMFYMEQVSWSFIGLGFVLFRLFDIWKPLGIRRIDRDNTPMSVLLDDVFAGILACAVLVIFLVSHASTFFP